MGTELKIKRMLNINNGKPPAEDNFLKILIHSVTSEYLQKNTFSNIVHDLYENAFGEDMHAKKLIDKIVRAYAKIRLHSLAKKETEKIKGKLVRQTLSKYILFCHQ